MPANPGGRPPRHPHNLGDRMDRLRQNHHQDGSGSGPSHTIVRSDPWQSVSALQLGLHPRPFQELHTERMYLLERLQQYNRRALELFRRIPVVDEQQKNAKTPYEDRRAKKLRGWLRHRISDTVEEERKTLARLSELHVEIQCQERWWHVEEERKARDLPQQHHNPNFAYFAASPMPSWPQENPFPGYGPYFSPYAHIGISDVLHWNSFPAQGIYPGAYWTNQTHLNPPDMPQSPDAPEESEADCNLTSDTTLEDTRSSHSEVSERGPGSEHWRQNTPSTIGEGGTEYAQSRRSSMWF
ncbi:hypothetical protein K445DRAFT_18402 [Daldinia sp. EC12]|nr:hypothetical protein K445DRAFT_18402 [Daldinia sp. EC12]